MERFTIHGAVESDLYRWFAEGLKKVFASNGYLFTDNHDTNENLRLVFNFINAERPRPFRRKAQATFVVSILETTDQPNNVLKAAYPYLVRSLSNHFIYISHDSIDTNISFITPEQGYYHLTFRPEDNEEELFQRIYQRLEPLASSHLIIDNDFHDDLPKELWNGDDVTEKLNMFGKKLDEMNLLPAPFPIQEYLSHRDLQHLKRLYGIGGLSYGNLSSRKDERSFWMSASGVNKANLTSIGEDLLLINGYNSENRAMRVSVPSNVKPKRASVDAIEHWMVYTEHPDVGAIVHIHAWMDGIKATEINYPCGTLELAQTVADLIRKEPNPSKAVIGLKNHGLTITGKDLDDIFERIEGRIIPQVPMS